MRRAAALLALLALPLIWPAWAQAHATLLTTTPGAGTRVAAPPHQLVLTFDQQIRPVSGGTTVVDAAGKSVMDGPAANAPGNLKQLVVPLQQGLPAGDYTVRWGIVSTDGHLIAGVYAFGVGTGGPVPQAESQDAPTDWPFLIARFFYFAGLLTLVGGVVYRVAAYQPATAAVTGEPRRLMGLRERHRANQVLALSAVLVLAGGWVALTRQGAQVAGVSFWEAFDHRGPVASALDATRFGRQFGRGIDVTAVFTILVALAYATVGVSRRLTAVLAVPAAIAGAWALAAPGISGHAGDPGRGPLVIGLDALHVAAAAIWIGGLVQLAVVTPHATRGLTQPLRDATRARIAGRFSRMAVAAVAVLAVTGGLRALWELSSVSQIWTTSYGRTLLAKTLLLLMTLAVASRSRRFLGRFQMLRRSVTAELVVLSAVVAAVALLTNLPPGSRPTAVSGATTATGGAATVALRNGGQISVWPGTAGPNAIRLSLPAGTTAPSLHLQQQDGTPVSAKLIATGPHTWLAWAPKLDAGAVSARATAGGQAWSTSLDIGEAVRSEGVPPAPLATGPLAAGEASDLAVAAQRVGNHRVRFTVLGQDGSASRGRCRHGKRPAGDAVPEDGRGVLRGAGQPQGRPAGCDGAAARPSDGRHHPRAAGGRCAAGGGAGARHRQVAARAALGAVREPPRLGSRALGGHDVHRGCARPAGDRRARWRAVARDRQPPLGSRERQLGEAADPSAEAARPVLGERGAGRVRDGIDQERCGRHAGCRRRGRRSSGC